MGDLELLDKTQKVMQVEQRLTALLAKVEPWLTSSSPSQTAGNKTINKKNAVLNHYSKRVRPIPGTMEQAEVILCMARNWAAKTSAPAGWEPTAPVIGFATPAPLPHQLRGGALAALQLERATTKKYKSQQQLKEQAEQESKRNKQQQDQAAAEEKQRQEKRQHDEAEQIMNPKKRLMHDVPESNVSAQQQQRKQPQQQQQQQRQQRAPPAADVTMNLSGSSSSEEESDDDDDDEEE